MGSPEVDIHWLLPKTCHRQYEIYPFTIRNVLFEHVDLKKFLSLEVFGEHVRSQPYDLELC